MHIERLIAHRILFADKKENRISRPVVRIATAGIVLGTAVMIIAISVVGGFKHEIREKLIGFNAHVQISKFDGNISQESAPFALDSSMVKQLRAIPGVKHVRSVATKAGILKKNEEIQGVVAKGVGPDYDWGYFSDNLVEGEVMKLSKYQKTDKILLSKWLASRLDVHAGDSVNMFFIQQPPRARRFKIAGIYDTGFEEFDKLYLFCDIEQLRKLNDWKDDEIGGLEVMVDDFKGLESTTEAIYESINSELDARSVKETYPQLFDWLALQDINALIIIALMMAVSGINMIAALLVIMLERVRMIGTLKALGATDDSIRKVFLWVSAFIIGRGMVVGNLIGIGLVLIQQLFHPIPLDVSSYYVPYVPVKLDLFNIIFLASGTFLLCLFMMLLPARWIGKVRPATSLRYD
ncbi:MAG: ABC transporter permease [Bacteroidota bacterium]